MDNRAIGDLTSYIRTQWKLDSSPQKPISDALPATGDVRYRIGHCRYAGEALSLYQRAKSEEILFYLEFPPPHNIQ